MNIHWASVSGRQQHGGEPFPPVLACDEGAATLAAAGAWIAAHRSQLVAQAARHGAILFRGFPLPTADDFDCFVAAFGLDNFAYEDSLSNAVRMNRTPRVFTANEAPASVAIYLHHELAQTPRYPSKLFFFCEQPAETGGQTPLCRSDVLWQRLEERAPRFACDCREKGLRYTNVMPAANDPNSGMGRSWQSTLKAATRESAEARLGSLGYTWQWLDDGCLQATTPVLPAVHKIAQGRWSFFNQLIAAYCGWKDGRNDPSKSVMFGDGAPLDPSPVALARALADELTFDLSWRQGDVVLVDNFVTMHGRRPFTGRRTVLASLAGAAHDF